MSKWITVGALWAGLVIACGRGGHGGATGSGIDSGRTLVSLSALEINDLCEFLSDLSGPRRGIDCGGGNMVSVGTDVASCVSGLRGTQQRNPACPATVGGIEDCFDDIADITDAQWCADAPPPESCRPLFLCDVPTDDQPPPPPGL
jgi:hypothetical protein